MALSRTVPRRPTPPTLVNFVVIYILFIIIVGMRERRSIHIPTNVTIYLKKKNWFLLLVLSHVYVIYHEI